MSKVILKQKIRFVWVENPRQWLKKENKALEQGEGHPKVNLYFDKPKKFLLT